MHRDDVSDQPYEPQQKYRVFVDGTPLILWGMHLNVLHHWAEDVDETGLPDADEDRYAALVEWLEAEGETIPTAFKGEPSADFIVAELRSANFDTPRLSAFFDALNAKRWETIERTLADMREADNEGEEWKKA